MSEIKNGSLDLHGAEYSKCNVMMTLGFKGLKGLNSTAVCPPLKRLLASGFAGAGKPIYRPKSWKIRDSDYSSLASTSRLLFGNFQRTGSTADDD